MSEEQNDEVKAVLERCLSVINSKYQPHDVHKMAAFLCPVFKQLRYLSPDNQKEVHRLVEANMQDIYSLMATSSMRDEHDADFPQSDASEAEDGPYCEETALCKQYRDIPDEVDRSSHTNGAV